MVPTLKDDDQPQPMRTPIVVQVERLNQYNFSRANRRFPFVRVGVRAFCDAALVPLVLLPFSARLPRLFIVALNRYGPLFIRGEDTVQRVAATASTPHAAGNR